MTVQEHGFAVLLDVHGQEHRPGVCKLGYGLSAVDLLCDDSELDRRSHKSSLNNLTKHHRLSELVRGEFSLGTLLEKNGQPTTPSTPRPVPVPIMSPLIVFYQPEFRALRRLWGKSPEINFSDRDGTKRNHGDAGVHGGARAGL